jgi:fructuronate reductase
VIEDRFADPADAALLQSAGVRVTPDVHSYEEAKLRMLNGSHTAMALMGAVTGRPFIASCIGVPHIREFVFRLMGQEVAPHLARSDWADYRDALIARFGNPLLEAQRAPDRHRQLAKNPAALAAFGAGQIAARRFV